MSSATISVDQRKTIAAMAGLFLLALVLRMIGAGRESAWCDEIVCLQLLDIHGLIAYLREVRAADPPMTPLYYVTAYIWSQVFGPSVFSMRLLSAVFSAATTIVLLALGRRMYGNMAGWVASLVFTFAPVHIYYGQEIRFYAFVGFWASLSMLAFHHILEKNDGRWWAVYFLCNFVLTWSHLFAVLIFPVQGAVLLLRYRANWPVLLRWTLFHAFLCLPLLYWISRINFTQLGATAAWIPPLTEWIVWSAVWAYCGSPYGLFGLFLPVPQGAAGVVVNTTAWAMVILAGAGVVRALWRGATRARASRTAQEHEALLMYRCDVLLLLGWLLVPFLTLLVMALFRNCFVPRYVLYCSLAVCILVGGLAAERRRAWAKMLAALVLLPYVVLAGLFLASEPIRADWKSASEYMRLAEIPQPPLYYTSPSWVTHWPVQYYGVRSGLVATRFDDSDELHQGILEAWRRKQPVLVVFGEDDPYLHDKYKEFAAGNVIYVYRTQPDGV